MSELGKGKLLSASALKNPFEDIQKKGQEYSVKYCAWEVLKDYCQGLNVTQIAKEIQERGLKDFSEKKNAAGQVSGDLVRGKGVFWHDPERKLWWIRPLAPIVKGNRSKASGSPATRNKKNTPGKQTMSGSSLVGLRVTVWWDGEKAFFDGLIDGYDEAKDRFRIVYDDGDADESMEFHKYVIINNEGEVDTVKVLKHNLDEVDSVPGSHEVAAVNPSNNMLSVKSEGVSGVDNNTSANEWKSESKVMDIEQPALATQGSALPVISNPPPNPQIEVADQDQIDRVETTPKASKKKATKVTPEKKRTKRTGKPGRPPKRSKNQGWNNGVRNRKRRRSFTQEGESDDLHLEDGSQPVCVTPVKATEGGVSTAVNLVASAAHQRGSEAAGSSCEDDIPVDFERKITLNEQTGNHYAQAQDPPEDVKEGSWFGVSTPIKSSQAPPVTNNETSPLESEPTKADEASQCVILRRKRSVMNRRSLQPGSSRVWGGSSLESRSNTGDEHQTRIDAADRSHNTSPRPSYKALKSPRSGKSSRCASPESISCTRPIGGGKSIGRRHSIHGKESAMFKALTRDLDKRLERGASIDMLDLTKGLFPNPRAVEPPIGQLGNVGELMSLSQLSEELKSKRDDVESQREAEVTSAPFSADVPANVDGCNANDTAIKVESTCGQHPEVAVQDLSEAGRNEKQSGSEDDRMETSGMEEDPSIHEVKCSHVDDERCGPGPATQDGTPQLETRRNEAARATGISLEDAQGSQCHPRHGVIAGPSLQACELSNSESRESIASLGDNPCRSAPRNPGGAATAQERSKVETGVGSPSGDMNKPILRDCSYPRQARPPMPIGVMKWSAPLLKASNLKLPCPIDGLKKRFDDWPYSGFFPPESVSNMKNLSESGCRPG